MMFMAALLINKLLYFLISWDLCEIPPDSAAILPILFTLSRWSRLHFSRSILSSLFAPRVSMIGIASITDYEYYRNELHIRSDNAVKWCWKTSDYPFQIDFRYLFQWSWAVFLLFLSLKIYQWRWRETWTGTRAWAQTCNTFYQNQDVNKKVFEEASSRQRSQAYIRANYWYSASAIEQLTASAQLLELLRVDR